jgi:hypothetical protein
MWADLTVGREGAEIVRSVRKWRKRNDFALPFVLPPSDEVAILSEGVSPTSDAPSFVGLLPDDQEWTDTMAQWCQARINLIGTIPEARALLLRRWPAEVPPLRDGYTADGVAEVLDLIAAVEAAFDLPFPVGDPRPDWNRGQARREGVQGHQPPSTQEQLNP